MKNMKQIVDQLYVNVAKYHGTTVAEVLRRTTQLGEPLIQQYYKATQN